MKDGACTLLRLLIKKIKTEADDTGGPRQGEFGIVPCHLRQDQFEMTQSMDFMSYGNSVEDDELLQYLRHTLSAAMRSLLQD